MSTAARLFLANHLYAGGVTVKNGAGGAPAINEDADRPMANVLIPSRYRFWRTSIAPASPQQIHFDLVVNTGIKAVGLAMLRAYRGTTGFTQLDVYSGPSAAYPPTWTLRATFAGVTAGVDNDLFADVSISARFWRFEFSGVSGQFSCKPWLVKTADVVTLTQGGRGAIETVRRVRERERETFLGGKIFNDLGIGVAERLREFRVPMPIVTAAQMTAIRTSQRGNVIYQHHDAKYYEVRHLEATQRSRQLVGTTVRHETELQFAQVP